MTHLDPDTLSSSLRHLPDSTVRLAFCGASGTGKTTLAKWAADVLHAELNPVGSRSVAKAMGFESPYDVDAAGKRGDFQRKLQADKVIWENLHPNFVTDRTTLDELTYTAMHDVKAIDARYFSLAFDHMEKYTHVVYCPVATFHDPGDDPARVKDITYHLVFDAILYGFLRRWGGQRLVMDVEGIEARRDMLSRFLGLL